MSRHAGLIDVDGTNQVTHGLLAPCQRFDDAKPRGVGQCLEYALLHHDAYVCSCIFMVKLFSQRPLQVCADAYLASTISLTPSTPMNAAAARSTQSLAPR